ncbi:Uncharacterised protein [Mycobacterium xenopi]|uniref:Uncharacterized protein n=1 Tax=Mycobacterium xenopi TaxID=1789 RepID=A0AAD1GZP8_MYCXE|nr:hypothetical protein MYXE_19330 [Mycobacterium xenopi]SPX77984.1 Uncharacterised protein [Mycobacterium xenopi]
MDADSSLAQEIRARHDMEILCVKSANVVICSLTVSIHHKQSVRFKCVR